ncbi:hypothetical protein Cgig2_015307 [Carnegiea gigantea]|uniref:RNA polymerase II subunit A C-terminal domain phosphatase SSU72 n=1 Tax=Carnegiea gigantea TaxID=171969 RepID=A0A9Q1JR19_9CARY|nr:hypothetical protein Cgig2_015307 [Carnegiea gigantea]
MKLRYAMVCSSNQNRSMEAHSLLKRQGFDVSSYGTGAHVKLPGPSIREPNVYEFGTPYKQMFEELRRKDPELFKFVFVLLQPSISGYMYKRNGILPMLKRNSSVKLAPQRWQDNAADGSFDVVITFEEKVFDMVIEDLHNRDPVLMKPVLIINLEVKDNHDEAAVGARLTLELCQEVVKAFRVTGNHLWISIEGVTLTLKRPNHGRRTSTRSSRVSKDITDGRSSTPSPSIESAKKPADVSELPLNLHRNCVPRATYPLVIQGQK